MPQLTSTVAFRRHPKIAGWLYTEHHDVINEWNGYWRFDRSEKFTGLEAFVEEIDYSATADDPKRACSAPTITSTSCS